MHYLISFFIVVNPDGSDVLIITTYITRLVIYMIVVKTFCTTWRKSSCLTSC